MESQGLRNYLLSLARSLHKLQERGKKIYQKGVTLKDLRVYQTAHGCCMQVGGWYSNSAHSWYWPKVIDYLRPCQRGDVKFIRISGIEDDQCKDTEETASKEEPFFLHLLSTCQHFQVSVEEYLIH